MTRAVAVLVSESRMASYTASSCSSVSSGSSSLLIVAVDPRIKRDIVLWSVKCSL